MGDTHQNKSSASASDDTDSVTQWHSLSGTGSDTQAVSIRNFLEVAEGKKQ